MRHVYTLTGSEDGTTGVYGSLKRAAEAAVDYIEQGGSCPTALPGEITRRVRQKGFATIYSTTGCTAATVEQFPLR
jgi:hypothetical protein